MKTNLFEISIKKIWNEKKGTPEENNHRQIEIRNNKTRKVIARISVYGWVNDEYLKNKVYVEMKTEG